MRKLHKHATGPRTEAMADKNKPSAGNHHNNDARPCFCRRRLTFCLAVWLVSGGIACSTVNNQRQQHNNRTYTEYYAGLNLEMVWVDAGSFEMGSPANEIGRNEDEGPTHEVELDGFWIARYPVTQRQYVALMGKNKNPSRFTDPAKPVDHATWYEARAFCEELARHTGRPYRLPTEAEWEYACRAGTSTPWFCGDVLSSVPKYCWYKGNSGGTTHSVGSKCANPWRLHDMMGNVWEWCADWYDPHFYVISPIRNPTGPPTGVKRVLRGGAWYSNPEGIRCALRFALDPVGLTEDGRSNTDAGFRVVRSGNEVP